jgi:hypothetical protein
VTAVFSFDAIETSVNDQRQARLGAKANQMNGLSTTGAILMVGLLDAVVLGSGSNRDSAAEAEDSKKEMRNRQCLGESRFFSRRVLWHELITSQDVADFAEQLDDSTAALPAFAARGSISFTLRANEAA